MEANILHFHNDIDRYLEIPPENAT